MELGKIITDIRKGSLYPRRSDFAKNIGISHEGLRKVESGARIPQKDTLDKILNIGGLPDREADRIRHIRDLELARQMDINLDFDDNEIPDAALNALSKSLTKDLHEYLEENEYVLPEEWDTALELIFRETLETHLK